MDFIAECIQKLNVQWSKKYDNNLHWKKTCPQIRLSFKIYVYLSRKLIYKNINEMKPQ